MQDVAVTAGAGAVAGGAADGAINGYRRAEALTRRTSDTNAAAGGGTGLVVTGGLGAEGHGVGLDLAVTNGLT